MTSEKQFCTFTLDGLLYGIPVEHVQEVLRFQELTPIPLAPPSVQGLLNLRGHIVVAVDLRRRLGLPERPAEQRPMNVVVQTRSGPVSLLVDEIEDMVDVCEGCEPPPDTLRGIGRDLIVGTYQLDHRLLLALDPAKAVDLTNEPIGCTAA